MKGLIRCFIVKSGNEKDGLFFKVNKKAIDGITVVKIFGDKNKVLKMLPKGFFCQLKLIFAKKIEKNEEAICLLRIKRFLSTKYLIIRRDSGERKFLMKIEEAS